MLRRVFGLASAPVRNYWTDIPFDPPCIQEHHHHHHPHPSEETVKTKQVKAWEELQTLLNTLPKRNYLPVIDELIQRSEKKIL